MAESEIQDQLILIGILSGLAAYALPWVAHPTAALALNGHDLAVWMGAYPPEWTYEPKFLTPLLLHLVPASVAPALAIWAQLRPDRAGKFTTWGLAFLIGLWLLPPAEFFRGGWDNLNHRRQFELFLVTVIPVSMAWLIGQRLGRHVFVLIGAASALGALAGVAGVCRVAPVVGMFYGQFRPGAGAFLTPVALMIASITSIIAWRSARRIPSGDVPLAVYRDLSRLRLLFEDGCIDVKRAKILVPGMASSVLAYYLRTGGYLDMAVELLTRMSTSDDPGLAAIGLRGMFPWLVERLSDAFDPAYCRLYDRAFAHVIDLCRKLPGGGRIDEALDRFGLPDADAMLARKERLRSAAERLGRSECERVRKVLILSRVTVGAEVAVTSVILRQIGVVCPDAERVLLGAKVMGQLFAGERGFRVRNVPYGRDEGLIGRLNNWLPLLDAVADELDGLGPDEYIVIDPDSRLSQLGLLPIVFGDRRYLFFESRGYRREGLERIGELTVSWLGEIFGPVEGVMPFVNPAPGHLELSEVLRGRMRAGSDRKIVSVSFGVGGNPSKRLSESGEYRLLNGLLSRGYAILIARGVGEDETTRTDRHVDRLRSAGYGVLSLSASYVDDLPGSLDADVVVWEGTLGAFCGVIGAGDVYLGYDSAGQHIAAAMGVPVVDIFVDRSKPMVIRRWRPWGSGRVVTLIAGVNRVVRDAIDAVEELIEK